MARIKNINGTSQFQCKCGSWIKHWERFSGNNAHFCSVLTCTNLEPVGAHVQKANSYDNGWYIVPLCNYHNQVDEELEIGATKLVSANKSKTCG